jgi:hypothetical protein
MERDCRPTVRTLTIALAVVLAVPAAAAPDDVDRKIDANETSAVAALEAIRAAQERFKAARIVDINQDGIGEYGLMRELMGLTGVRTSATAETTGAVAEPAPLRSDFGRMHRWGEVLRAGYRFHLLLPGPGGVGVVETGSGPLASVIDSNLAETTWSCYAWPDTYGVTGKRAFFINQDGVITATEQAEYSGSFALGTAASAGAALDAGSGSVLSITGDVAINSTGRDGNQWRLVTPRTRETRTVVRGRLRNIYDYRNRRRRVSFVVRIHRRHFATDEIVIVRAEGLRPSHGYDVALDAIAEPRWASLGVLRTDESGRGEFRFDSRVNHLSGGAAVSDFLYGTLHVQGDLTDRWAPLWKYPEDAPDVPPNVRVETDEAAAVAALHDIAAAQEQFRATGKADVDTDDLGEYGMFRELSGTYAVRTLADGTGTGTVLVPPLQSSGFGRFNVNSEVSSSGYLFHMILPGFSGIGVIEVSTGALAAPINNDLAETKWCCYAWPVKYGVTGKHTYFVNQDGIVTTTEHVYYSGTGALGTAALAGVAFRPGTPLSDITGQVAINYTGLDGNLWRRVTERPNEHESSVVAVLTPPDGASTATGTLNLSVRDLRTITDESITVMASPLPRHGQYRVVLTNELGDIRFTAGQMHPARHAPESFWWSYDRPPQSIATWRDLSGGTVEILDHTDAVVLRGAIPHFATLTGPNEPGASLAYHAAVVLTPGPYLRLKRGLLDVRATADAAGTSEDMTLTVTTFDRLADRADVVAIAGGVETRLGTIRLSGDRGTGTLVLDTSQGDTIPGGSLAALAGQRVDVRDETGAVLLTGTFPSVE